MEEQIRLISQRLANIEESLGKLAPLVDVLHTIVQHNMNKQDPLVEQKSFQANGRDLVYTIKDDFVYMYGLKTYSFRDLIKATFREASWSKEHSSWRFKKFENFEETMMNVFPNIVKDQ